jgi:hypothetical protein
MDSLRDIVGDIRTFLYGGALTFPLTIAGTLSVLGLFTANYAILFFLVGFLILAPLSATILNFALGTLFTGKSFNPFKARTSDVCKLVMPYTTIKSPVSSADETVISSTWVAMVAFFLGYIFTNALQLYNREVPESNITITSTSGPDVSTGTTNRKSQAIVSLVSIVVFGLIILGFRYYTGCESIAGMILTTIGFVFLGNGWYQALSKVGQDRLSDLFGIANRLLPPSAISNAPIACVPVPA